MSWNLSIVIGLIYLEERSIPFRNCRNCDVLFPVSVYFVSSSSVCIGSLKSLIYIFNVHCAMLLHYVQSYRMLWYWEPSVVTALSILGLVFTIADYLLPLVSKTVSSSEDWNSEKEKKFSIFVNRIAYYSVQVWNSQVMLEEWKKDHPNVVSVFYSRIPPTKSVINWNITLLLMLMNYIT